MLKHPDIHEAAAVGVPDQIYGEEVVCYAVTKHDAGLTEASIRRHCATFLPPPKMPTTMYNRLLLGAGAAGTWLDGVAGVALGAVVADGANPGGAVCTAVAASLSASIVLLSAGCPAGGGGAAGICKR